MTRVPAALRAVKTVHTLVWAIFAGCIIALPVTVWRARLDTALTLTVIVACEVLVLAVNHMRCPLTDVAARYSDDRSANFDIYLPLWLARYNKLIFGWLFVVGVLLLVLRWQGWHP